MKVRCEYCQNMVEVTAGADRICPYCGSPLPAAPEPPKQTAAPKKSNHQALLVIPLALVIAAFFVLIRMMSAPGSGPSSNPGQGGDTPLI